MAALDIQIVNKEFQTIYGLWKKSNDKTISADIAELSKRYHGAVAVPEGEVLPYFVLSRNYDERSKDFELFIGSTIDHMGLESFILPAGEYARATIQPKLGFLWGIAIGQAKKFVYKKWLPESSYTALNMEYEYHTEKSRGKRPVLELLFAVQRRP